MSRHGPSAIGIRDIMRWWPLAICVALLAVAAAIWSQATQKPSYTATTNLVVVPLAQWDETFLGTSLVRDAADAQITAATTAAQLDSHRSAAVAADYLGHGWTPESVDAAIKVSAVENANVITIAAQADDPARAVRLAEGYARAALEDRWRTIATELDARIAAMAAINAADPGAGEAATRLQTLTVIRDAGADPTMWIESTSPPVRNDPLPIGITVGLAAVGGLFVGSLAAFGMARLRRRADSLDEESAPHPEGAPSSFSNGDR